MQTPVGPSLFHSPRRRYVTMVGESTGRFNNFLIELARLLASAVGEAEATGVLLPALFFEALDEFDWRAATSPWACVVRRAPLGAEVVHLNVYDVWNKRIPHQVRASASMAQPLLSPLSNPPRPNQSGASTGKPALHGPRPWAALAAAPLEDSKQGRKF